MANKIQIRRDSAEAWTLVNPLPAEGEICLESDTSKLKVGDGLSNWDALPYIGGIGSFDFNDLNDVVVPSPNIGDTVIWDGNNWVSEAFTNVEVLNDLLDVTVDAPAPGQALVYTGTGWANATVNVPENLDDLNDVSVSTPSAGQTLIYNGSEWENAEPPEGAFHYKGTIDVTVVNSVPADPIDGDLWLNTQTGTVDSSWGAPLAGTTLDADTFVAYADNRWIQAGSSGITGQKGEPGTSATIQVGTVTVLPPGAIPVITNVGSNTAAIFDFRLPTGPQGTKGEVGEKGTAGVDGEKGEVGQKGEIGIQGIKGSTGNKGEIGGTMQVTVSTSQPSGVANEGDLWCVV